MSLLQQTKVSKSEKRMEERERDRVKKEQRQEGKVFLNSMELRRDPDASHDEPPLPSLV